MKKRKIHSHVCFQIVFFCKKKQHGQSGVSAKLLKNGSDGLGWDLLAGSHARMADVSRGSYNKDLTVFQRFLQLKCPGHYSIRFVHAVGKDSGWSEDQEM